MQQTSTLFDTTIGKKAVMAVTGLGLFGFVIGHMLGNLQVYLGPEALNAYAEKLHSLGPLLWVARISLLVMLVLHVWMMFSLWGNTIRARETAYRVRRYSTADYASRTMWLTGPLILLFVAYHLAHFTFPGVAMGDYEHLGFAQVYTNVVNGFSVPWVVLLYVLAQIALGFHLYHGSWSMLQTMGIAGGTGEQKRRIWAKLIAASIVVGNVSIPVAVLAGIIR